MSGAQITSGLFFWQRGIRIKDLIGPISAQTWTPATLNMTPLFDGFAIGYDNGNLAFIDFSNFSEVNGQILSAKHIFHDRRHSHTVKKFRLVVQDNGSATYQITVKNNLGYSETQVVTLGTGSGDSLSTILTFDVTGLRIQWTCVMLAGMPGSVIEFAPMFINGGEQRGGNIE
jgi:hypothetical protein